MQKYLVITYQRGHVIKICHGGVKDNKSLRLEVHHAKRFDDICKENNLSTIEQAIEYKELQYTNDAVSICYRCHKHIESLRTKLRICLFYGIQQKLNNQIPDPSICSLPYLQWLPYTMSSLSSGKCKTYFNLFNILIFQRWMIINKCKWLIISALQT